MFSQFVKLLSKQFFGGDLGSEREALTWERLRLWAVAVDLADARARVARWLLDDDLELQTRDESALLGPADDG